jgi:hypothetical protein
MHVGRARSPGVYEKRGAGQNLYANRIPMRYPYERAKESGFFLISVSFALLFVFFN